MTDDRIHLAEDFLREAVYRSRATQAMHSMLAKRASPERGNCGLGEKAAIELDLSPRGRELFEELFAQVDRKAGGAQQQSPSTTASIETPRSDPHVGANAHAALLKRIHARMREWIESQDALDRSRNHFLKAFRGRHGFDRTKYSAAETAELDAGLARINDEEDRERLSAAKALLTT
jgi:hypothetical protein